MAIDNSLYDSLENSYNKIKEYLESTTLGREHSQLIMKNEELAELLERLDIEAIEEQSKDIHALHDELNQIKVHSNAITEELANTPHSLETIEKIVNSLDNIFSKINGMIV